MAHIDLNFDRSHLWHPYTSMIEPLPTYAVQSAKGVHLLLEDGRQLVDGMSSWWSTIHGYNHPELNAALIEQSQQMSHVMFGGLTHRPAIELGKKLVDMSPEGLECIFLADSGSVSVEVALKMAIQYWIGKKLPHKKRFLTIKHGYHGDTFAAMSVCDPVNSMHSMYADMVTSHLFAEAPQIGFEQTWHEQDLASLTQLFEQHHHDIAALILEPIVQGAGGMRIYHPQYLKACRQLCDQFNVLLICDEIATGFGRTGKLFACEHAQISPDILCVGKALTGGYMTLAATLCQREVAETIGKGEAGVLMHGPTFMGNPLACAVANASLAVLQRGAWKQQVVAIEQQLQRELTPLKSHNAVTDVRVLGAIGVVETKQPVEMAKIQAFFVNQGVWIRPFGRLIYIMPPFISESSHITQLTTAIGLALDTL